MSKTDAELLAAWGHPAPANAPMPLEGDVSIWDRGAYDSPGCP